MRVIVIGDWKVPRKSTLTPHSAPPRGNPAVKLAVTVDADVHAKVLDAAEAEGKSVAGFGPSTEFGSKRA